MEKKVALITGSSSGIGRATALRYAEQGWEIVIHGTNSERIKQVSRECRQASKDQVEPLEVAADFACPDQIRALITNVIDRYGRLDVLVNNTGLFKKFDIHSKDAYENYRNIMMINFDSAVLLTSLAVPFLRKSSGRIVNISSNLGIRPCGGTFAYSAAKAALSMFTKSLAIELAPYVQVNSISPGPIATLMPVRSGMPIDDFKQSVARACLTNRIGEADEIARVVLFLTSNESSFITGSDFVIDGGSLVKPAGVIMESTKGDIKASD